jgi:drug/metabolite transporter (DMT)-like permease
MWIGLACALAAGLMWGLVFVAPLMLPEYPAPLLTVGRYLAFGVIALPLALMDLRGLRGLRRADWLEAARLSLVGNFIYFLCLAGAIQRAGGPLPTVIIGTLPVVIAVCSNSGAGALPWARLAPALGLMLLGIACVNQVELAALDAADLPRYLIGAALACVALACWTWYPIRNAAWLRSRQDFNPRAWATAQGLVTLPMALAGLAAFAAFADFHPLLGPRPPAFVGLMLAVGLLASWLGALCWNTASQRLPTGLLGQLIVFETLSALTYAWLLRGSWPAPLTLLGAGLLIGGVLLGLRAYRASGATGS